MSAAFSWGGEAAARRWIKGVVRRIARKARPEKIILFGSRARGRAKPDSDFDLLVILRRPTDKERRYALVSGAIGDHDWPVDLLVRQPEEIAARLAIGDSFMMDILKKGRVLYES